MTTKKTGFWLQELAAPNYAFMDAGAQITLASPKAGSRRSTRQVGAVRPKQTRLSFAERAIWYAAK